MKKHYLFIYILVIFTKHAYSENKMLIGILPFKNSTSNNTNYSHTNQNVEEYRIAIQDAVTNSFLKSKRFNLVEREKMNQINSEKELQKSEDFIDGSVVEQSKSLGAQYVVIGNITEATVESKTTNVYMVGSVTTLTAKISFSIKVVDVATSQIIASGTFSETAKGKNAFSDALEKLGPEIENFIKENFKITATVVQIEEKNKKGEAFKVLIAAGSSTGLKKSDELKVFENTEVFVDGHPLTRKKYIGKIIVDEVEDENFSKCLVKEGGKEIVDKIANGVLKCEFISN